MTKQSSASKSLVDRYDAIIQELKVVDDTEELESHQAEFDASSGSQDLAAQSVQCAKLLHKALLHSAQYARLENLYACDHDEPMQESEGNKAHRAENQQMDEQHMKALKELMECSGKLNQVAENVEGALYEGVSKQTEFHLDAADDLLNLYNPDTSAQDCRDNSFRDLYMESFTDAFGDELDQFRQHEDFGERDVSYLISCIHAGADIFTTQQKEFFLSRPKIS